MTLHLGAQPGWVERSGRVRRFVVGCWLVGDLCQGGYLHESTLSA